MKNKSRTKDGKPLTIGKQLTSEEAFLSHGGQRRADFAIRRNRVVTVDSEGNLHEDKEEEPIRAEYVISNGDTGQQKYWKGIQRQQNFHKIAKDNPVIVEADPKIVSWNLQPQFEILSSSLRRKKKIN